MLKMWPFAIVAAIMVAILIAPLPARVEPQPAPTSSRPNAAAKPSVAPVATASADAKFDLTLSGGLVGHWQSSASGPPRCNILGNALQVTVAADVNGAKYGLGVRQNKFTSGTYVLPATDSAASPPSAQITTAANPKAQWDLGNGGVSQGTITLSGGTGGSLLTISIDGDLADLTGGKAIHVSGTISCHPVSS